MCNVHPCRCARPSPALPRRRRLQPSGGNSHGWFSRGHELQRVLRILQLICHRDLHIERAFPSHAVFFALSDTWAAPRVPERRSGRLPSRRRPAPSHACKSSPGEGEIRLLGLLIWLSKERIGRRECTQIGAGGGGTSAERNLVAWERPLSVAPEQPPR